MSTSYIDCAGIQDAILNIIKQYKSIYDFNFDINQDFISDTTNIEIKLKIRESEYTMDVMNLGKINERIFSKLKNIYKFNIKIIIDFKKKNDFKYKTVIWEYH
jgi:hypothetical protein